jgi:hypothetical protein
VGPDDQKAGRPAADLAVPLRWIGRFGVVVVGLLLIVQGLRESWSAAVAVVTVLAIVAIVTAVVFVVLAVLYFARRGREG